VVPFLVRERIDDALEDVGSVGPSDGVAASSGGRKFGPCSGASVG
jgi:hypothetical protein